MKSVLALCVLCCGILSTSTASASAVNFAGTVTAGGGGSAILGTIPPDPVRPFVLSLNFNDGAGVTSFLGSITSGTFSIPAQTFNVTGGSILVAEGGAADTGTFIVDVNGPAAGQLIFTFTRNAIVNSNANQANINALTLGNVTSFTADFTGSGAGAYTGSITGVPEPSSCLALIGCVLGGGYLKARRKRNTEEAIAS